MRYELNNQRHMDRLREEYDWSRGRLKHARRMYKETWRRYAGDRYTEHSDIPEAYLLLTRMAFGIFRRHLVADNIKTMVSTAVPDLMATAYNLNLALDDKIKELQLSDVFKTWVSAALAKMGILYVGLDHWCYGEEDYGDVRLNVEFVDFNRFTYDMWARSPRDFSFCGDRHRVSFEEAMDNPLFKRDSLRLLRDVADSSCVGTDEEVDDFDERWGYHGSGEAAYMEFDRIYLPKQKVIIGLPCDGPAVHLHDPIPWEGREEGPYHLLSYDTIPNKVLPSPPSDVMAKLDDLANSLMRKMAQDAKNAKTVTLYPPGGGDDALAVKRASNLEFVPSANPGGLNQVTFNGVDAQTMGAFLQVQRLFSWTNGGLDTLGGLSTGADTARQEQQLLQTAGTQIDEMRSITINAMAEVVRHVAHYCWRDEMWRPNIVRYAPGLKPIGDRFEIEDRMGELEEYRIRIWPYSGAPVTPQTKFQALDTLMQRAMQLLPLAQTGAIDFDRTIKHYARWLEVDEVEDVFNVLDTTGMPGPETEPKRQDDTTRRYVRESKSGVTPEARDNQVMESMRESA